jgi:hypothetical protein
MDFVTWVLLRFDSLMAEADKKRSDGARSGATGSPERVLPLSALDQRETANSVPERPAA